MNELFNAQILERAGLAAVALASVYANYKLVINFNKTLSNHIEHQTKATEELRSAVEKLIRFLEKKLQK